MDDYDLPGDIECRARLPRPVIQIGMPPDIQHDLGKYIVNRIAVEDWKRDADANHAANLSPMEHNAKNTEIITRFLSEFIDKHYVSERPPGLSLIKHSRAVPGYVEDLRRAYPTNDGYDKAIEQYNSRVTTLDEHARQIEAKKRSAIESMMPSQLELASRNLCISVHLYACKSSGNEVSVPLQMIRGNLDTVERLLESMDNARKTNTL